VLYDVTSDGEHFIATAAGGLGGESRGVVWVEGWLAEVRALLDAAR